MSRQETQAGTKGDPRIGNLTGVKSTAQMVSYRGLQPYSGGPELHLQARISPERG